MMAPRYRGGLPGWDPRVLSGSWFLEKATPPYSFLSVLPNGLRPSAPAMGGEPCRVLSITQFLVQVFQARLLTTRPQGVNKGRYALGEGSGVY